MTRGPWYVVNGKDVLDAEGDLVIGCRYEQEARWVAGKLNDGIKSARQDVIDKAEPHGDYYWIHKDDVTKLLALRQDLNEGRR